MYTVNRSVPSVRPLPLPSNDKYLKIALDKNPVWGASSKRKTFSTADFVYTVRFGNQKSRSDVKKISLETNYTMRFVSAAVQIRTVR